MGEKLKNSKVKLAIGVIIIVLIVAIVLLVNDRMKKEEAERQVEEARQQLNEALDNLHNIKPNSNTTTNNGITNTEPKKNEIQDYINNYFVLESASVEKTKDTRDRMALKNVKVKNNGEKTINNFKITVYFQDEQGKDIAEDYVSITETIKPNYSWQLEKNTYYPLDNIPDEASQDRTRIAVTEVEFE